MDFFSSSFDAEIVLNDLSPPSFSGFRNFESVDKFEQYLWNTNANIVTQLQKLELQENADTKSLNRLSR